MNQELSLLYTEAAEREKTLRAKVDSDPLQATDVFEWRVAAAELNMAEQALRILRDARRDDAVERSRMQTAYADLFRDHEYALAQLRDLQNGGT